MDDSSYLDNHIVLKKKKEPEAEEPWHNRQYLSAQRSQDQIKINVFIFIQIKNWRKYRKLSLIPA
jgi:hypothetical protein